MFVKQVIRISTTANLLESYTLGRVGFLKPETLSGDVVYFANPSSLHDAKRGTGIGVHRG